MDAFFVEVRSLKHPYNLRCWAPGVHQNASSIFSYDGVKFRTYNFLDHSSPKELPFIHHDKITHVVSIYDKSYPGRNIFICAKNRRNLIGINDNLKIIQNISFDTNLLILDMIFEEKTNIFYISGNFGWLRAIQLNLNTTMSGSSAEWIPLWTTHDTKQWYEHICLDSTQHRLFASSGKEIYCWNSYDGNLLFNFQSKHDQKITDIKYSNEHMFLFTASSDGKIKTWRLFGPQPENVFTIEQNPLGPIKFCIDKSSITCISYERILRRYNMTTGALLGELDLEPEISAPEMKNVEVPIYLDIAFTQDGREWLFESEKDTLRIFQMYYAPNELAVACEDITNIAVDPLGGIWTLCKNNILQQFFTDGTDGKSFDLDSIPFQNNGCTSDHLIRAPKPISRMIIKGNRLFFTYSSGELTAFDTRNGRYYQFNECDLENSPTSISFYEQNFTNHHICTSNQMTPFDPAAPNLESSLFIHCHQNGAIGFHCSKCLNFVGSWKLSKEPLLGFENLPNSIYFVGFCSHSISIYKAIDNSIKPIYSEMFEDNEEAISMSLVTDKIILIGTVSGKGIIYSAELISHHNMAFSSNSHLESLAHSSTPKIDFSGIDIAQEIPKSNDENTTNRHEISNSSLAEEKNTDIQSSNKSLSTLKNSSKKSFVLSPSPSKISNKSNLTPLKNLPSKSETSSTPLNQQKKENGKTFKPTIEKIVYNAPIDIETQRKLKTVKEEKFDKSYLKILHNAKLHDGKVEQIISCRELLKIDEANQCYKDLNMDGLACSLGSDNTFTVIDCFTGLIQTRINFPKFKNRHNISFCFKGKPMIALSIDKNLRLFKWPEFDRIVPIPEPESVIISDDTQDLISSSDNISVSQPSEKVYANESIYEKPPQLEETSIDDLSKGFLELSGQSILSHDKETEEKLKERAHSAFSSLRLQQEKPKQKIELAFENGWPKLVIKDLEEKEEKVEPVTQIEFDKSNEFTLADVFMPNESQNNQLNDSKKGDIINDVMKSNTKALEEALEQDPELAKAFKTKTVASLSSILENESDANEFYDYYLSLDVKHLQPFFPTAQRKQKVYGKPNSSVSSSSISSSSFKKFKNSRPLTALEQFQNRPRPEPIKPIGGRKKRKNRIGQPKRYIIVTFKDGTKMKAPEITADYLSKMIPATDNPTQMTQLTPGWIFNKTLNDLEKHHKAEKLPIVRKEELLALPIITLMNGSYSVGGDRHRFFPDKPLYRFPEDSTSDDPAVIYRSSGEPVRQTPFMHWEDVLFGNATQKEQNSIMRMEAVSEDDDDEDDDSEEEENDNDFIFTLFPKTRHWYNGKHRQHSKSSFSTRNANKNDNDQQNKKQSLIPGLDDELIFFPNKNSTKNETEQNNEIVESEDSFSNDLVQFPSKNLNIFEFNNPFGSQIINNSPSLKEVQQIYGGSENPLLDLVNNAPILSPEEIEKQLHSIMPSFQQSTEALPGWKVHPIDVNMSEHENHFSIYGESHFKSGTMYNRPPSPPPIDAVADFSRRLNFGSSTFSLDTIPENSFQSEFSVISEETSSSSSTESTPRSSSRNGEFTLKRSPSQEVMFEQLKRPDFKALRDSLRKAGLLNGHFLLDLPRWQPTTNFMTKYQVAAGLIKSPLETIKPVNSGINFSGEEFEDIDDQYSSSQLSNDSTNPSIGINQDNLTNEEEQFNEEEHFNEEEEKLATKDIQKSKKPYLKKWKAKPRNDDSIPKSKESNQKQEKALSSDSSRTRKEYKLSKGLSIKRSSSKSIQEKKGISTPESLEEHDIKISKGLKLKNHNHSHIKDLRPLRNPNEVLYKQPHNFEKHFEKLDPIAEVQISSNINHSMKKFKKIRMFNRLHSNFNVKIPKLSHIEKDTHSYKHDPVVNHVFLKLKGKKRRMCRSYETLADFRFREEEEAIEDDLLFDYDSSSYSYYSYEEDEGQSDKNTPNRFKNPDSQSSKNTPKSISSKSESHSSLHSIFPSSKKTQKEPNLEKDTKTISDQKIVEQNLEKQQIIANDNEHNFEQSEKNNEEENNREEIYQEEILRSNKSLRKRKHRHHQNQQQVIGFDSIIKEKSETETENEPEDLPLEKSQSQEFNITPQDKKQNVRKRAGTIAFRRKPGIPKIPRFSDQEDDPIKNLFSNESESRLDLTSVQNASYTKYSEITPEQRPTTVGKLVSLNIDIQEMESFKLIHPRKHLKTHLIHSKSMNDIFLADDIQPPSMHMFGRPGVLRITKIFIPFYAPTIWNHRTGKVRRDSI